MMTQEQKLLYEHQKSHEFVGKLARLVSEYKSEVNLGAIVGALDIVKMRLFHEAQPLVEEEMRKWKGQKNETDES